MAFKFTMLNDGKDTPLRFGLAEIHFGKFTLTDMV